MAQHTSRRSTGSRTGMESDTSASQRTTLGRMASLSSSTEPPAAHSSRRARVTHLGLSSVPSAPNAQVHRPCGTIRRAWTRASAKGAAALAPPESVRPLALLGSEPQGRRPNFPPTYIRVLLVAWRQAGTLRSRLRREARIQRVPSKPVPPGHGHAAGRCLATPNNEVFPDKIHFIFDNFTRGLTLFYVLFTFI
jgi:hypothetical protein